MFVKSSNVISNMFIKSSNVISNMFVKSSNLYSYETRMHFFQHFIPRCSSIVRLNVLAYRGVVY